MLLLNKYLNGKIAEMIEHGIVAASALLVAHGANQSQVQGMAALFNPESIAAAIVGLLNLAWSMWRAHAGNKLVSAVKNDIKGAQVMVSASSALVIVGLFLTMGAQAQAPLSTNMVIKLPLITLGTNSLSTNQVVAANDLLTWLEPLIPYLESNKVGTLTLDGTYSSGGHYGGFADFEVPIAPSFSLGVGGAYVDDQWFIAPVSAKLGTVFNIPVIGQMYTFTEAGMSLRYGDSALGLQSATGAAKTWTLSPKWQITADGGKLLFTQSGSPSAWFGGLRITYAWGAAK